jgi:uncharacterized protein
MGIVPTNRPSRDISGQRPEVKKPKIEFPCDYPIKVIGESVPGFLDEVMNIVRRHDATIALDKVKEKPSSKGNYSSITLLLWATGEPQLQRLFTELKKCTAVRLVL